MIHYTGVHTQRWRTFALNGDAQPIPRIVYSALGVGKRGVFEVPSSCLPPGERKGKRNGESRNFLEDPEVSNLLSGSLQLQLFGEP